MRDGGKTRRAGAELSRCEGQEGGVARAGRMKEGGGEHSRVRHQPLRMGLRRGVWILLCLKCNTLAQLQAQERQAPTGPFPTPTQAALERGGQEQVASESLFPTPTCRAWTQRPFLARGLGCPVPGGVLCPRIIFSAPVSLF